jgi:hypothetical protein
MVGGSPEGMGVRGPEAADAGGGEAPPPGSWAALAAGLVGQVQPGVLLFLRRVRQLEVLDELAGVRHTLRRTDREGGAVVEVRAAQDPAV